MLARTAFAFALGLMVCWNPGCAPAGGNGGTPDGDDNGSARVDVGVDEFGSFQFCDLNCDGQLNGFDIDPFILALTHPDQYATTYPDCDVNLADCNGDGLVNGFDVAPFIDLLLGG